MDPYAKLARHLLCSKYTAVLTGAGVSAESGLPTFRGRDGLWERVDPEKFTISYFLAHPYEWWRMAVRVSEPFIKARPSKPHKILARLEELGYIDVIITQNIDGLHQRAGSKRVVELHGNIERLVCPHCHREYSLKRFLRKIRSGGVPACEVCGAILKPSAVLFGEPLPRDAYEEAVRHARSSDLFLVLGSSLLVHPAAELPRIAKDEGAVLVIVNVDETPLDGVADLVIRGRVGRVLERVERLIRPFGPRGLTGRDAEDVVGNK